VSNANQGASNWPPPSFSPDTGLFYLPTADTYAMYYLAKPTREARSALAARTNGSSGPSAAT